MKYRNKRRTRLQREIRKFSSEIQSLCDLYGLRAEKNPPRWRQLKKERTKIWKSMDI